MFLLRVELFKFVHVSIDDPEVRVLVTNVTTDVIPSVTVTWDYHWGENENPPPLSLGRYKGGYVEDFGEFGEGPLKSGESREFALDQGSIPMLRNVLAAASTDQYRIVVRADDEEDHIFTGAEFAAWFEKNFPEGG